MSQLTRHTFFKGINEFEPTLSRFLEKFLVKFRDMVQHGTLYASTKPTLKSINNGGIISQQGNPCLATTSVAFSDMGIPNSCSNEQVNITMMLLKIWPLPAWEDDRILY
jgi:hypothetical protein